ncbi:ATP-binding cassette domain-containing protein [Micromonospora peucetia]|uniref:ABC-type sugar transport system, ATPase component n=1 Tax=Micromonospora peucetia TaxID=47871 RepID=A0A1C6W4Z0_9ACTN|nr:ATP-binding cassette domain-containing protein [Micromonospora peucetia]SCL73586.1 ABC-type sugar transport system, ATPase component [Micromonospora peucetia]
MNDYPPALLHLDGVGRRYGGLHALHDISITLPTGARHAVIGPNGAGKSTLFGVIAGSVRPTSGRVLLDGRDVNRLGPAARARRGVGRTFQHPAVFGRLSAAANVALAINRRTPPAARSASARRGMNTDRARAVLHAAGLAAYADMPAAALPYGVRRRLELAVALTPQPRLLLLDEPSAGLDPGDVAQLVETIRALPPEVTVLLIDHHLDLVWDVADTVTVLQHGNHIATGTPDEIRADTAVRAVYLTTAGTPAAAVPDCVPDPVPPSGERRRLLEVRNLQAGYDGAPAVHDLNFDVFEGKILALLGRNGAGKTTVLNALAGLTPLTPPTSVTLGGGRLPTAAHRIARAGLTLVPQGRRLFSLTVAEHLTVAAATATRDRHVGRQWSRDDILALLPALGTRLRHSAERLSGGEQQMLAFARALLARPRVLLLDEPSEGLAPALVQQISVAISTIAAQGVGVVIAEQNLSLALSLADDVVVLEHGHVALTAATADFTESHHRRLHDLLGVTPVGANA